MQKNRRRTWPGRIETLTGMLALSNHSEPGIKIVLLAFLQVFLDLSQA